MSRIIDITVPVSSDMLTWPSDPAVEIEPFKQIGTGDASNVSTLSLGTHTGTHVDPPFHFLENGETVDALDLAVLVGPAMVVDLTWVEQRVGPDELAKLELPEDTERLLMRTRNSELWTRSRVGFPDDYVAVTPEGASWLVDRGIRLVGTDFLSIEQRGADGHPVHTRLLEAGVVIVEGLALFGVDAGIYELAVLPLKISGGDGAPARAVLISR